MNGYTWSMFIYIYIYIYISKYTKLKSKIHRNDMLQSSKPSKEAFPLAERLLKLGYIIGLDIITAVWNYFIH